MTLENTSEANREQSSVGDGSAANNLSREAQGLHDELGLGPAVPDDGPVGARVRAARMLPGLEAPPWLSRGSWIEDRDVLLPVDTGEANPLLLVARSPEPEPLEAMFQGMSLEGQGLAARD